MRTHASGQGAGAWKDDLPSHQQIVSLLRDRQPAAAEQYVEGAIARYAATAYSIWENQPPAQKKPGKKAIS